MQQLHMLVHWKTVNYMSLAEIHTTCISGYKSNPHLDKLRLKIFNDHLLYCASQNRIQRMWKERFHFKNGVQKLMFCFHSKFIWLFRLHRIPWKYRNISNTFSARTKWVIRTCGGVIFSQEVSASFERSSRYDIGWFEWDSYLIYFKSNCMMHMISTIALI